MKHLAATSGKILPDFSRLALWCILMMLPAFPASAVTRYVAASGSAPSHPYTSWATAASDIQTAVSACSSGDVVIVTNGTYTVSSGTEVVLVSSGIHLQSVNGSAATIIDAGNVAGIRRGLHMTATASGAVVEGFSITRGRADGNWGGGAKVEAGTLQNCVISNNWCSSNGDAGGVLVAGGIVSNCVITRNGAWVYAGGAQIDSGAIRYCAIYNNTCGSNASYGGGGVFVNGAAALLENCIIRDNRSGTSADGGGVLLVNGTVQNCLIWRNVSPYSGGVYMQNGTLQNCTIVQNRNFATPTGSGLRQLNGNAVNLIIWGNTPTPNFNRDKDQCPEINKTGGTLNYSCTVPIQPGTGNLSGEPAFVDPENGNFRLAPGSIGIDTALPVPAVAYDLDGVLRPVDGDQTPGAVYDMGCYESGSVNSGTFRCSFSLSTNEGITSVQAVLRPRPAGTVSNISWYGWDTDNDGLWNYSGSGSGIVTNTFGTGFHTVTLRLTNASAATATCAQSNIVRVATPAAYVRPSGGTPTPPYSSWDTAATNLDEAIRHVTGGGAVWVTNGTYSITSQIEVVKGITLKSMQGADNTLITRSSGDTRIMLVGSSNALIQGFRMENGYILSYIQGGIGAGLYLAAGTVRACNITTNFSAGNAAGGGAYITGGLLDQCRITRNRSWMTGGGIYQTGGTVDRCIIATNQSGFNGGYGAGGIQMSGGTVQNSIIHDNRCGSGGAGGGIWMGGGQVRNCTVAHNLCGTGGGGGIFRNSGTITNSIIANNLRDLSGNNYAGVLASINYSSAPELTNGAGNLTGNPGFIDPDTRDYHLSPSSPCLDTGINLVGITNDLDGAVRPQDGDGDLTATHDMGGFERADATTGSLEVDFEGDQLQALSSLQVVFTTTTLGADSTPTWYGWDFNNDGTNDLYGGSLGTVTNTFFPGIHTVSLSVSNASLEHATRTRSSYIHVSPTDIYVATNGSHVSPYTNWAGAANNLNDAIQMALAGATLRLSNGNYSLSSTLAIDKAITLQGVFGASNTVLRRVGTSNFRVLYLDSAGAVLDSLRITNGYDSSSTVNGVGIYMTQGTVRNCIIEKNTIAGNAHGAGIYMEDGLVENSIIRLNIVNLWGGGIYMAGGMARNCLISRNWSGRWNAAFGAGGAYLSAGRMRNCLISGNQGGTAKEGGGVYLNGGILESCTISGNLGGTDGGGVYRNGGSITNCIIRDNQILPSIPDDAGGTVTAYAYSCAPELTSGTGNITDNPRFLIAGFGYGVSYVPGDYRLAGGSPCINAGVNMPWMKAPGATDMAGVFRVSRVIVDIGAYEDQAPQGTLLIVR